MYFVTHIIIWFQVNLQFIWPWAKENPWTMSALGLPISYVLIIATKHIVTGFEGLLWPGRLVGFSLGMVVFAVLTSHFMNEGLTPKTIVSLVLATSLVAIQILWK